MVSISEGVVARPSLLIAVVSFVAIMSLLRMVVRQSLFQNRIIYPLKSSETTYLTLRLMLTFSGTSLPCSTNALINIAMMV